MNLSNIEVFVKVVEQGSISAAARALDLTVSTTSGKLLALEHQLGVTLIQRTTRKLHVTPAGEAYFRHCAAGLAAIEAGAQELTASLAEPNGLLRVSVPPDLSNKILVPMLGGYLEQYPKVQVDLIATARLVDFIAEGIDLGLRFGDELKDSSLKARRLTELRFSLWAAPAYLQAYGTPQTPAALKQHHYLRITSMPDQLTLYQGKKQAKVIFQPARLAVDSLESLQTLTLMGQGISVLPDFFAASDASAGKLCQVLPGWLWERKTLRFVYPAQRFVDIKRQSFIDYCLQHLPEFP